VRNKVAWLVLGAFLRPALRVDHLVGMTFL
jgi:hypothetical protein